jgi:hypothetical protein
MKKAILLIPIVASLAACGTFGSKDPYERAAEREVERRDKLIEQSFDKAPKWMTEVPVSESAIYAAGTATSGDFSMADEKAKTIAFGKICITAGGEVDKQTKVYMVDTQGGSSETSETAIRSMCRKVDVTGARVHELKRTSEGGRYRTYVLVALPMGDANLLRKAKVNEEIQRSTDVRSREAFRELDSQTNKEVR